MRRVSTSILLAAGVTLASVSFASADWKCVANGQRFTEGQFACLKLPGGARLAQCAKVLNNSSWKILQEGCPESTLTVPAHPASPAGNTAIPVKAG